MCREKRRIPAFVWSISGLSLFLCSPLAAQTSFPATLQQIGYGELKARLGPAMPTGALFMAGQIEASPVAYRPSQYNAQFNGKSFTMMSGTTSAGSHATTVGTNHYGATNGPAPGMPHVYVWQQNDWFQNYLHSSSNQFLPPELPPDGLRTMNHSWVDDMYGAGNYSVLRRTDAAINRDRLIMVCAISNLDRPFEPLLAGSFNAIAVGRADGQHNAGPTADDTEVAGRSKPDLVAPGSKTSWAAPLVTGGAVLLFETVLVDPVLSLNANSDRPEVIKACLLGGTVHRPLWANDAFESGPNRGVAFSGLDPKYGLDLLNLNRSHLILTGGQRPGGPVEMPSPVPTAAWDLKTLDAGESSFYRFATLELAPEVSITATWNRIVEPDYVSWSIANVDLYLWRIENGELISMVGDAGLPYFGWGNVTSQSTVENVEHIYLRDLAPGHYVFEARRVDGGSPADIAISWFLPQAPAPGDLNGDGVVDASDLGNLLVMWGSNDVVADLDGSGQVDGDDLGVLLSLWY